MLQASWHDVRVEQWDDLRFVLAVVRAGTLTGAAKSLGVNRTTVGRRLHALEASLEVRLFDEHPEGLLATEAGQELVEAATRVEAELLAVGSRLAGRDLLMQGELRISTLDFVYECFSGAFRDFIQAHPGLELSVLTTDEEVSLRRREADVALRMKDLPPETLVGRRLGQVEFGIYGARSLVAEFGPDAPLEAYPWLRYDARDDGRGLDPWYRKYAEGAKTAMGFDGYGVMRHAVRDGLGLHFLPRFDAERFTDLQRVGPDHDPPTRTLWALTLPALKVSYKVRALMEHLDAAIRPALR